MTKFVEGFESLVAKCITILEEISSGVRFSDIALQEKLADKEMKSMFGTLHSELAFRRLTSICLTESANTIVDTCSCLFAISRLYESSGIETRDIADRTVSTLRNYLDLTKVTTKLEVSSFQEFDCSSDFADFLEQKNKIRDEFTAMSERLDAMKFKSVMCYNCNEHPAISALAPCGHAFMCFQCLSEAMDSQLTRKCYICGKEIQRVLRLRFSE